MLNFIYLFISTSKTRLAFENISARMEAGQTVGEATNNTGIELTQAAQVRLNIQVKIRMCNRILIPAIIIKISYMGAVLLRPPFWKRLQGQIPIPEAWH